MEPVRARKQGDIAARTLQHTDVAAQLRYIDLRGSGSIANGDDRAFTFHGDNVLFGQLLMNASRSALIVSA